MAVAPDALKYFGREMVSRVGGQLSGIVGDAAHTYGYHRAFNEIPSSDYSRRVPLDQVSGTAASYASAVDWNLPDNLMKTVTARLRTAALHPEDNRLDGLREFYGTLDGSAVYGLSHDGHGQAWNFSSADSSHLWHIHLSFFRQHANDKAAADRVLSVVSGQSWEDYKAGGVVTPAPTPNPTPNPVPVATLRINSGVSMDSVGQKLKTYLERVLPADLLSRMYITSNFRSGDPGYHGDQGSNGALDFAAAMTDQGARDRRDAARIVIRDADLLLELIHTTPFSDDNGFYVKNGQLISGYGEPTNSQHLDHIHIAISEANADRLLQRHPAASTPAPTPTPPPVIDVKDGDPFPLPAGHYFGDVNGPNESHGGHPSAPASDRSYIKAIQLKLVRGGFAGTSNEAWADGLYEGATVDAVRRFQAAKGLSQDGKVGPETWGKLFPKPVPPTPAPTPPPSGLARTYTVKPGDTLTRIARKFGVTIAGIMALNPEITDPNKISVGQTIKLMP